MRATSLKQFGLHLIFLQPGSCEVAKAPRTSWHPCSQQHWRRLQEKQSSAWDTQLVCASLQPTGVVGHSHSPPRAGDSVQGTAAGKANQQSLGDLLGPHRGSSSITAHELRENNFGSVNPPASQEADVFTAPI